MQSNAVHWALCLSLVPSVAHAQATWNMVATQGPAGREFAAMAYDSARQRTVMFGGSMIGSSPLLNDTWEWNGSSWLQRQVPGPGARTSHAMTYDSQRGRVVLFGGMAYQGSGHVYFGDTWEWDGAAWLPQVFASGPVARGNHAMAYDVQRGRVIMFGGAVGIGTPTGDTWEWNGLAWAQAQVAGPAPRAYHAMAHDTQRGRTVLFGGWATNGTPTPTWYSDTWEWDGSAWTQVYSSFPSARSQHAMVYDSQRARVVVVGGWNGTQTSGTLNGTWEWDGAAWSGATLDLSIHSHAMAYDSQRVRTVLFGGTPFLGNTWELSWATGAGTPFGAGCGSPPLSLSGVAAAPPAIGTTAQATIANIPSPVAVIALGFNNTAFGSFALPLTLVGFGMPGCNLLHSAEVFGLSVAFTSATTARFDQPLPNNPAFVGQHVYLQAFAVAPGVNPGQLIASNAWDWAIGY